MNNRFEFFWGRFTRISAFLVGLGIMVYETIGDSSDRPWLYGAAIGMMGLPIARAAEGVLGRFESHGPQRIPNPSQSSSQPTEPGARQ